MDYLRDPIPGEISTWLRTIAWYRDRHQPIPGRGVAVPTLKPVAVKAKQPREKLPRLLDFVLVVTCPEVASLQRQAVESSSN